MKKFILTLLFLIPLLSFAQECVYVDSVYVTCKIKELKNRSVLFGIKQITEETLSNNFKLCQTGIPVRVEVYYVGMPKKSITIGGYEQSTQRTDVKTKVYFGDKVYDGLGSSNVEASMFFTELKDDNIPFSQTSFSNAIKISIINGIEKIEK